MSYSLAIDIGGTFTDLVLIDSATGRLAVAKVLTSYPDPSQAVLAGVRAMLTERGIDSTAISRVIHGTTLVTNALIERKGARTALITTAGFRDALEIGREGRYDIYDLGLRLPAPLVERRLRMEAPERVDAQGNVLTELDAATLEEICAQLAAEEIEAVAITFLHAYANPEHERRAAEIVRARLPAVALSLSHAVAPELREFERTSTTVANAYVQPLTARYLRGLEAGLQAAGVRAPLHIMLSNAGTCSVATAAAYPIRLVESGPAGGALAGAYWGRAAGRADEVLAFDMGGTTAKAILTIDGKFPLVNEAEAARVQRFKRGSGLPLLVPMLDMIEIGAGGGSIARLNDLGLPTVGPESAGSAPGPACYAAGGVQPTVTDADLLLGYLNPDYFVGGEIQLDPRLARQSVAQLAAQLDLSAEQMALGIHQLVNENMASAARVHAAERGLDLRKYVLVATGGAGPGHACGVAERLGIGTVIVPPAAGVGSAFGMQLAPISFEFSRTYARQLDDLEFAAIAQRFAAMEAEGREIVTQAGVAQNDIRVARSVDMRYVGQGFDIRVPLGAQRLSAESFHSTLKESFEREYEQTYGRLCPGVPLQPVTWRTTVSGPRPRVRSIGANGSAARDADPQKATRPALFGNQTVETPVFDRYALAPGCAAAGPCIIEEAESTTVVRPGWNVEVDAVGNLVLTEKQDTDEHRFHRRQPPQRRPQLD